MLGKVKVKRASFSTRYFPSMKSINKYKTDTKKEQKAREIERGIEHAILVVLGKCGRHRFRVFFLFSFFFHGNRVTRESGQKHRVAEEARAPET